MAALLALVLAGCAGSQGVSAWATGNSFSSNNGQVLTDIQGVQNGIKLRQLKQLHTVCEALSADSSTVYQTLPTPVQALTDAFSKAYSDLSQAGRVCYYAPSFSSPAMKKFEKEFQTAKSQLSFAMSLLTTFQ